MEATDALMPGPGGKTPKSYDVSRGTKTESYITAVNSNPIPPYVKPLPPPRGSERKGKSIPIASDEYDLDDKTDSPLDRNQRKPQQIGLTQEQLLPYRDDPFWRRLRWSLFIMFWLTWLGLFIVALLILFLSPKCALRFKPTWWQSAVTYNVWLPSFSDGDGDGQGDVLGLIQRLEQLRKTGVSVVWPRPFLLTDEFSGAVRDYRMLDTKLGVNTDAEKLIEAVHEKGMKIVIDLPLTTTSLEHDWFLRSLQPEKAKNKDFSQFYTWSRESNISERYFTSLPNRPGAYFHKLDEPAIPIVNWKEPRVRMQILEVLSYWMDKGVDGFHLTGIEFLARSEDYTMPKWSEIAEEIANLRRHIDIYSEEMAEESRQKKIVIFASLNDAKENDKRRLVSSSHLHSLINYELSRVERNSKICHKNEGSVGVCVYEILSDLLIFHSLHKEVSPQWEMGNKDVSRVASRVGSRRHSELLLMLQLLLPGTNTVYYGDEIGMKDLPNDTKVEAQRGAMQWKDSVGGGFSIFEGVVPLNSDYKNVNWERQFTETQSLLKTFLKLSKLRKREDLLATGQTLMGQLVDGAAFTMARFEKNENYTSKNIYVIGVNFAPKSVDLPLDVLPSQMNLAKAQIIAVSSNVEDREAQESLDFHGKTLNLGGDKAIVFRYPYAQE